MASSNEGKGGLSDLAIKGYAPGTFVYKVRGENTPLDPKIPLPTYPSNKKIFPELGRSVGTEVKFATEKRPSVAQQGRLVRDSGYEFTEESPGSIIVDEPESFSTEDQKVRIELEETKRKLAEVENQLALQKNAATPTSAANRGSKPEKIQTAREIVEVGLRQIAKNKSAIEPLVNQGGKLYKKIKKNGGDDYNYEEIPAEQIKGRTLGVKELESFEMLYKDYAAFMNTPDKVHEFKHTLDFKKALDHSLKAFDFNKARDIKKKLEDTLFEAIKWDNETKDKNLKKISQGPAPYQTETWQAEFIKDTYGSRYGTGPKYINKSTGEWVEITADNLKFFEHAQKALQRFHNRHETEAGMVEKKNEILGYLNAFQFEMASTAADEYISAFGSKNASGTPTPPRGASVPPVGSGGAGTPGGNGDGQVPSEGIASPASAPQNPTGPRRDTESLWPEWIHFEKGGKGKPAGWVSVLNKDRKELSTEVWETGSGMVKSIFTEYRKFMKLGTVKEQTAKEAECVDLIDQKNKVRDYVKKLDIEAATGAAQTLKDMVIEWNENWPKRWEKINLEKDFAEQKEKFVQLKERMKVTKDAGLDLDLVLMSNVAEGKKGVQPRGEELEEILEAYEEEIAFAKADKKLEWKVKSYFESYKDLLESYQAMVLALENKVPKIEGSSDAHPILRPKADTRTVRLMDKREITVLERKVELEKIEMDKKEQGDEARTETEEAIKTRHKELFDRDPKKYLEMYDGKNFESLPDGEHVEKAVHYVLGTADPVEKAKIEAARTQIADEKARLPKVPKNRMTGQDYLYSPRLANQKVIDKRMKETMDTATGKPRIDEATGKEMEYNACLLYTSPSPRD